MIRVYGFSLESDWRFEEAENGFLKRQPRRLMGMEIWLPSEINLSEVEGFARQQNIPILGLFPKPEKRIRLAVTPDACHTLERSGIFPPEIAGNMATFRKVYFEERSDRPFQVGSRQWNLAEQTLIMGILNITPDSFYDGGQFLKPQEAVRHAGEMVKAGADILDVGAESTRPGAHLLTEAEEMERLLPVIEKLRAEFPTPISVDTNKASVARAALQLGAAAVNDISGLHFDPEMPNVVAQAGVPVFLMHIQGTPASMQKNPNYQNVMGEILKALEESKKSALQAGVLPEKISVDPGIGFGKRWYQNYQILGELEALKMLEAPILVGPSRKSFLGAVLQLPPEERLEGTLVATAFAIRQGADILRVHDVPEVKRAAQIADFWAGKGRWSVA